MATNEVSGGWTPVQAGRVLGKSQERLDEEREDREAAERAAGRARGSRRGGVRNVREGNATVGYQADEIDGDVTVTW